jgi:hypothetical protein
MLLLTLVQVAVVLLLESLQQLLALAATAVQDL